MASSPENVWVKFFCDAGLPPGVSATYALTFTDNRIQMNMLLDLNKEYLREMGISCMGDVIAILRHAKQVHEETARDRVLSNAGPKVPVAAIAGRPGIPKPNTPATRMLEHYTRNSPVNVSPSNSVTSVKERLGNLRIAPTKRKVATTNETSIIINPAEPRSEDGILAVKRLRTAPPQSAVFDDVALNVQLLSLKNTSNVFSRLGSADEPRTITTGNGTSRIKITGLKQDIIKSSNTKTVFSRLGEKDLETVSLRRDSADSSNEPLKYEGILKGNPPSNKFLIKTNLNTELPRTSRGTMRADEIPVSVREKLPLSHPQRKSVKFSPDIDYKEIEKRPVDNTVTQNLPMAGIRTVALSKSKTTYPGKTIKRVLITPANVKMRLGKSHVVTLKSFKARPGVFGRLGVTSQQ